MKITNKKEAWMLFLSSTDVNGILEVCDYAPEFIPIYEEAFEFGKDVKRFVSTFSDSLRETDRNAERLMVEELQEEVRQKQLELQQQKELFQKELQQLQESYESEIRNLKEKMGKSI